MDLTKLKDCFEEKDIEWRVQQAGTNRNGQPYAMVLAYVTNRAIMNRLDEVCGAENWKNEFKNAPDGGILCGISIKCGDEWVTKWDGAENTQIEAVKGGLSGAMKRAAVQWGIGRYLYELESNWAEISENGKFSAKTKEGKWFKWNPPRLPDWALPRRKNHKRTLEIMLSTYGKQMKQEIVNEIQSAINSEDESEQSAMIKRVREYLKACGIE